MKTKLLFTFGLVFIWHLVNAQGTCSAGFTYTTSTSGISTTNTSTGTVSVTSYTWDLIGTSYSGATTNSISPSFGPLYNGTYELALSISDSLGCSNAITQTITISGGQPVPPCVATFTFAEGSNGLVTFTNTSPIDPYAQTSYFWFLNSPYPTFSATDTISMAFYYNGTYTVTLGAYNTHDDCYTSSTQTITITSAHPSVACNSNFTYTVGMGGQVDFTTLYTGTDPGISYTWEYGDAHHGTGSGSNPSFNYAYNGNYVVTCIIQDSIYCNSSTSQTITVNTAQPLPPCQAMFTYTLGSGGQVSFTNVSDTATIPTNYYVWMFQGSLYLGYEVPTFTYSYNGTYTVSLWLENSNAYCSDTTTQIITITNAAPSPCTNLSAGFTYSMGTNGQVSFTGTSIGTDTTSHYIWNFGDRTGYSYYDLNKDTVYSFASNDTYSVSLVVSKAYLINPDSLEIFGFCYDSIIIPVAISNIPICNFPVGFTYTASSGGQVNFTDTTTGVPPDFIISWNFGDGTTSSSNNPAHTFVYNGTYYVYLNISDSSGNCSNGFMDSVIITSGQICNLQASFTYTVGNNGQVNFTNTSIGMPLNAIEYWYFGDGNSSSFPNPTNSYAANGVYYVQLNVYDSTGICWSAILDSVIISNACATSVNFTLNKDSTQAGVWDATPNYSPNVTGAVWSWGDGSSTGGLYPSHTYTIAGWYTICATAYSTCGDSIVYCQSDSVYRVMHNLSNSMIYINVVSGGSNLGQDSKNSVQTSVYPNPATSSINIASANELSRVDISNSFGEIVLQVKSKNKQEQIDISKLPSGIYVIRSNDFRTSFIKE